MLHVFAEEGPSVEILFLNKKEVEEVITREEIEEAVELAFRTAGEGKLIQPVKSYLAVDSPKNRNHFISMPTYLETINVAGIKWCCLYWDREPGIPPVTWGDILILNYRSNGLPYAIMDCTTITNERTAAHSVIAAKYLAKKNSKTAAIIGCGATSQTALPGLLGYFGLEKAKIYDIKPEMMDIYEKNIKKQTSSPINIVKCSSNEEAVKDADIVIVGTSSMEPIVKENWIAEGACVIALNSFCDLDPKLSMKADKWVLGNKKSDNSTIVMKETAITPIEELSVDNVYADLGEIIAGKVIGRENEKERIVYTHKGMGALDVAVGDIVYKNAKKAGIGNMIKLI
ncbi:MAG: hypothetical protein M0P77_01620 [Firmicutes bacterium]|nr:hypothetical protein [Bacillota bacterium]